MTELRIIGGEFKRKKISAVKGMTTRPTTDRVRESLFNILGHRVQEKVVLDLYAGTGALGMEALSRGSDFCVFIDAGKAAIETIKKNILALEIHEKTRVLSWDIQKNLNCLNSVARRFNLVFLDPPYNSGYPLPTLKHLLASGILEADALVVIEHSVTEPLGEMIPGFLLSDQRTYGKTCLSFLVLADSESLALDILNCFLLFIRDPRFLLEKR